MYVTLTCITILIVLILFIGCIAFFALLNPKDTLVNRLSPFILLYLIIISLCCSPCLITMFVNDTYLWQFQRNFQQISHPSSTKLLASASDVGLFVGNSNHCDFYVGETRWTNELSSEQIREFYRNMQILPVKNEPSFVHEADEMLRITVIFVANEQLNSSLPITLDTVSEWGVDISKYRRGTLYIVQAFDAGYEP